MTAPILIDTKMHGREALTGVHLIRGSEKIALIETGPKSCVENVLAGLHAADVDHLDWIIVTHIHLDHAGGAGTLARRFPEARVAVHEVGAPHLVDPSKLWKSASRIYGDAMERLWGGIDPIAGDRIEVLKDGQVIGLGDVSLTAIETPGHAYHHHAYLSSAGDLFAGDALGVRLPDVGVIRPATPPPEFHLEKALASIRAIADLKPTTLWPTHFGPHTEGARTLGVSDFCKQAVDAFERWAGWVEEARAETTDIDAATEIVRAKATEAIEGALPEEARARMDDTTSYRMNTWGYMRYFEKHPGP